MDQNRRFVTTSDDKSIRVWEWWVTVLLSFLVHSCLLKAAIVRQVLAMTVYLKETLLFSSKWGCAEVEMLIAVTLARLSSITSHLGWVRWLFSPFLEGFSLGSLTLKIPIRPETIDEEHTVSYSSLYLFLPPLFFLSISFYSHRANFSESSQTVSSDS